VRNVKKIIFALFLCAITSIQAQTAGFAPITKASRDFLPQGLTPPQNSLLLVSATGRANDALLMPRDLLPSAGTGAGSDPTALRIEALVLLPWAPQATAAPLVPQEIHARLLRVLTSIHTMEGIEYWSASRQRMRTLYERAYFVDPDSRATRTDPPALPRQLSPGYSRLFYAFMKDLTFGGNVMKYSVELGESALSVRSENASAMKYMLLPLVGPGGMKSDIVMMPCRDGLLGFFAMELAAPQIVAERVFESAGNKLLGVLGWFVREAEKAQLTAPAVLPVDIDKVATFPKR
jgi:hypothetical protein